ncbi:hypothetical protein PLESTF_001276900 [Pleodorina starrii]|nr:hypothetical protein PLESTF_001276900 [Pleodorina starrii]
MQNASRAPPEPVASAPLSSSPSSVGRFGAGLRGQSSSPTALDSRTSASLPTSPQRSAAVLGPVQLAPPLTDVSINYFTYGATKDTMIRSPGLHRHVLSTSFDTEAARQVAQVCTLSAILQGPVDAASAGTPMASGHTAPGRSPYLQPLASRKRSGGSGAAARPGDPTAAASAPARPGLPMPLRPLSSLIDAGVVGAPGAGVRRARRHGGGGGGGATSLGGGEESQATAYSTANNSSGRGTNSTASVGAERSGPNVAAGVASRTSVLSSVYGQPSAAAYGGPAAGELASSSDESGDESGGEDRGVGGGAGVGIDSLRYRYLSQYVPRMHLPPSFPPPSPSADAADEGEGPAPDGAGLDSGHSGATATATSGSDGGGVGPSPTAVASSITIAPEAVEGEALDSHLAHLHNLHGRNQYQPQAQPQAQAGQRQQPQPQLGSHTSMPLPVAAQQAQSDSSGPLPSLELRLPRTHRAASASSVSSLASSTGHDPLAAARRHAARRVDSLPNRAAGWRHSLAADGGAAARRAVSGKAVRPVGAPLGGTLADWVRQSHSVHSIVPNPDPHVRAQASGLWADGPQQQRWRQPHRNDGGGGDDSGGGGGASDRPEAAAGPAAAAGGGGGRRHSSGGEDAAAAAVWGRSRRRRGPIYVDPELVRQYTERPPKLYTPNNTSRPVTSSDFAAFKNHTVNRAGTANTLRTVLGSNAPAGGGAGGAGGGGGAAAAEARGVTPLTTLLGPAWVAPALRPRSPHLGVGGVTGSATCVPGLHVPLELEPPPRALPPPPPGGGGAAAGPSSPSGPHTHLFRRSPEVPDRVSSLGASSGTVAAAAAAAAAAGDRAGTPLTVSTFGAASSVPAPVQAMAAPRAGPPPHVRCGAGELVLDVNAWLTPPTAPTGELCGLFNGDDGESVALLSRVVKGAVQCDLGWAEVSESLMFMSTVTVPNAVLRFPVPHRAILQRFAATIGGTTLIAEAVARSAGGIELEEDEEDDDPGPGKVFTKGFGRRNHPPGAGGRAPMLRVPLGKVRGDIFITISYVVQLEASGNTLSLTHVCNWTPARTGWHLAMSRDQLMSTDGSSWLNSAPQGRRTKHKPTDLYDLSFELEILSHRGLNLVSGPRHMAIKPNYDALLIQGYTQVWRPRHVTTVTFELALAVPLRSFAILHDARRADLDVDPAPGLRRAANPTNDGDAGGAGAAAAAAGGGGGGGSAAAASPLPTAPSSLRLIVPTGIPGLNPGGDAGKGTITLRSAPPAGGLNLEPRPLSTRHCAAVTFVPNSHFSPAELEDVLGPDVAPGPRAQAAAIRAGLPAGPGPLPVELWVVVDCCGPAGIAAHLMQMLQTLQVLLRSLPVAEGGGGGAAAAAAGSVSGCSGGSGTGGGGGGLTTGSVLGGGGGGSSVAGSAVPSGGAAGAVAAATLFNVVICPAAPLVLEPEDEEAAAAAAALRPPELANLHLVARQQQQQQLLARQRLLQQHQQQAGGDEIAAADGADGGGGGAAAAAGGCDGAAAAVAVPRR